MNRMMTVRRGRAAELRRRARVRLDVRRFYPADELSSRYLDERHANGGPRSSMRRPMTLVVRLEHCVRWLKQRVGVE